MGKFRISVFICLSAFYHEYAKKEYKRASMSAYAQYPTLAKTYTARNESSNYYPV